MGSIKVFLCKTLTIQHLDLGAQRTLKAAKITFKNAKLTQTPCANVLSEKDRRQSIKRGRSAVPCLALPVSVVFPFSATLYRTLTFQFV